MRVPGFRSFWDTQCDTNVASNTTRRTCSREEECMFSAWFQNDNNGGNDIYNACKCQNHNYTNVH